MGRHDFRVVDLLPHAALLDDLGAAEEVGGKGWPYRAPDRSNRYGHSGD
jgi:hypothetical protein